MHYSACQRLGVRAAGKSQWQLMTSAMLMSRAGGRRSGTRFGPGFRKLSYSSVLGNDEDILETSLPVAFICLLNHVQGPW